MEPQRLTPLRLLRQPQQQTQNLSVFVTSTNNLTTISIQKENLASQVIRPRTLQRIRNRTPPRRRNQR
jgi:hypothetical protein